MESLQKDNQVISTLGIQRKKYVCTRMWRYSFTFEQLDELYWMICGLMNTKEGGTIAIGVNEKGKDIGVTLKSSDKDELEREMSYSLDNVAPKIARISTLNFVSTTFREVPGLDPRLPPNIKSYVVEINVNPGNPTRYYTRLIPPMKKVNVYVRTAAQIRGFETDVSNTKKNSNHLSVKFEPETKPETYSQKHMQLNQVRSYKNQNDQRKVRGVDPRCLPKNQQINDVVARIERKNDYINELIAKFVKMKSADLGKNLEDLDAVVFMLNHVEDIAIQTYTDFYKKVYDREVKDVRYTH